MSLVPKEQSLPAPPTVLEVIAQAACDPNVDVAKMRELLAMQKEIVSEERRITYIGAMVRVQAKLPQFGKSARVVVKGVERSRYAPIEAIDTISRPILSEEGFAVDYDVRPIDTKNVLVVCRISHQAGHFEERTMPLPVDFNDFRSGSQSAAASVTLGKRHLLKNHLNIVEKGVDTDGNATEKITEQQALDLKSAIESLKGNQMPAFLKYMEVEKVGDILATEYKKALTALEAKRKAEK